MKTNTWKRSIALAAALTVAWSEGAGPLAAASLWADRRAARQGPTRLAALPTAEPLGLVTRALTSPNNPSSENRPAWAAGWDLASVQWEKGVPRQRPDILLIRDVHAQEAVQKRISSFLRSLASGGRPALVGVEGASGPLDFRPFRAVASADAVRRLSDAYLSWDWIQAPEHAGLTGPDNLRFVGVETPAMYDGNVEAYRQTTVLKPALRAALDKASAALVEVKKTAFTPEQAALDERTTRYRLGRLDTGEHLEALAQTVPAPLFAARFPQTKRFLQARSAERGLDFSKVEKERAELLSRLSSLLTEGRLRALTEDVVRLRADGREAGAFHAALLRAADGAGVSKAEYPALRAYAAHAAQVERLDREALMAEIPALEDAAWLAGRPTPAQEKLHEMSKDLALAERLAVHALTDDEWSRWEERLPALRSLDQRLKTAGVDVSLPMGPFEAFYRFAKRRDTAMLENFLAARRPGETSVLVAGGFHADGIVLGLKQRGLTVAVLTPRIDALDTQKNALDAFTREASPLNQLLTGHRIFMAAKVGMGPATAPEVGSNEYDDSAFFPMMGATLDVVANPSQAEQALATAREAAASSPALPVKNFELKEVVQDAKGVRVALNAEMARGVTIPFVATTDSEGIDGREMLPGAVPAEVSDGKTVPVSLVAVPSPRDRAARAGARLMAGLDLFSAAAVAISFAWILGNPWGLAAGVIAPFVWRAALFMNIPFNEAGHAFAAYVRGYSFKDMRLALANHDGTPVPLRRFFRVLIPFTAPPADELLTHIQGEQESDKNWNRVGGLVIGMMLSLLAGLKLHALVSAGFAAGASVALQAGMPEGLTTTILMALYGLGALSAIFFAVFSDVKSPLVAGLHACGIFTIRHRLPKRAKFKTEADYRKAVMKVLDEHIYMALYAARVSADRGAQFAGLFIQMQDKKGQTVFVEVKVVPEDRRDHVIDVLENHVHPKIKEMLSKGYTFPEDRGIISIGHARYATTKSTPEELNAQPHRGMPDYMAPMGVIEAGQLVEVITRRAHVVNHNGDDNARIVFYRVYKSKKKGGLTITNKEMRQIQAKLTGYKTRAQGDTPMLPMDLDSIYDTGAFQAESVRAALFIAGMASFELEGIEIEDASGKRTVSLKEILKRVSAPKEAAPLAAAFEKTFSEGFSTLNPGKDLEETFKNSGALLKTRYPAMQETIAFAPGSPLEALAGALEEAMAGPFAELAWTSGLDDGARTLLLRSLVNWSLKNYFLNDLHRGSVNLVRDADPTSTYGLSTGGLHTAKHVWMCQNQPLYLWMSEDGEVLAGASESNALKGARGGDLSKLPLRFTMSDGDVVEHDDERGVLTIYNIYSEEETFIDIKHATRDPRVVDMRNNRYGTTPEMVHPKNRAQDDLSRVAGALQDVENSFSVAPGPKDDPNDRRFWNYRTAERISKLFVEKIHRRRELGASRGFIDILLIGTAQDRDIAINLAEAWRELSGQTLKIEVLNAAEYSGALSKYPIDRNTTVFTVDHFGFGANIMFAGKFLRDMKRAGKCGDIFLLAGGVDNLFSEQVLKQELHDRSPFMESNILSLPEMSDWFPAEARSLTNLAPQRTAMALTRHIFGRVAEAFPDYRPSPEYNGKFADAVAQIDVMLHRADELTQALTGFDAEGQPLENNKLRENVLAEAKITAQHRLETRQALILTALHLVFTFFSGKTLPGLLFGVLHHYTGLAAFDVERYALDAIHLGLVPGVLAALVLLLRGEKRLRAKNEDRLVPVRRDVLMHLLRFSVFIAAGIFAGQLLTFPMEWAVGHFKGVPGISLANPDLIPLSFQGDFSPVAIINTLFYFFFGFLVSVIAIRTVQRRDPLARLGGRSLLYIDQAGHVADRAARFTRRVRGLTYALADYAGVYGSTASRAVWDYSGATNARGGLHYVGVPRPKVHASAAAMASLHLLGAKNGRSITLKRFLFFGKPVKKWHFKTGPEMIGVGFDASVADAFHRFIVLDDGKPALEYEDPYLQSLNETLAESTVRLVFNMVHAVETEQMVASHAGGYDVGRTQNSTGEGTTTQVYEAIEGDKVKTLGWPELDMGDNNWTAVLAGLSPAPALSRVPGWLSTESVEEDAFDWSSMLGALATPSAVGRHEFLIPRDEVGPALDLLERYRPHTVTVDLPTPLGGREAVALERLTRPLRLKTHVLGAPDNVRTAWDADQSLLAFNDPVCLLPVAGRQDEPARRETVPPASTRKVEQKPSARTETSEHDSALNVAADGTVLPPAAPRTGTLPPLEARIDALLNAVAPGGSSREEESPQVTHGDTGLTVIETGTSAPVDAKEEHSRPKMDSGTRLTAQTVEAPVALSIQLVTGGLSVEEVDIQDPSIPPSRVDLLPEQHTNLAAVFAAFSQDPSLHRVKALHVLPEGFGQEDAARDPRLSRKDNGWVVNVSWETFTELAARGADLPAESLGRMVKRSMRSGRPPLLTMALGAVGVLVTLAGGLGAIAAAAAKAGAAVAGHASPAGSGATLGVVMVAASFAALSRSFRRSWTSGAAAQDRPALSEKTSPTEIPTDLPAKVFIPMGIDVPAQIMDRAPAMILHVSAKNVRAAAFDAAAHVAARRGRDLPPPPLFLVLEGGEHEQLRSAFLAAMREWRNREGPMTDEEMAWVARYARSAPSGDFAVSEGGVEWLDGDLAVKAATRALNREEGAAWILVSPEIKRWRLSDRLKEYLLPISEARNGFGTVMRDALKGWRAVAAAA